MFVLRRLPAFLALLMLGALSLRLGLMFMVAVPLTLVLVILLFIPRNLMQTLVGAVLWGGCLAWIGMGWLRVNERLEGGQPWLRLVFIFGAVLLFTAWAAWLMRNKKMGVLSADDADSRG